MDLDQLERLTRQGFFLFPCTASSKKPCLKDWEANASKDPEYLESLFRKLDDGKRAKVFAAIACGPSNVFVLDVDPKNGGQQSLTELEQAYGPLPLTRSVRTGSGGTHYYFRQPAARRIRNSQSKIGKGLDIRGDGGFVISPPSIHANGNRYEWLNDSPIVDAPMALLDKLRALEEKKVSKGDRQNTLKKFACELSNKGATADELREAVHLFNREECNPPKSKTAVDSLVDWVLLNHRPVEAIADYDLDWFAFNCKKFFGDTNIMTMKDYQLGWWTRLQAFAWLNKGVLPSDPDKLARLAGAEDAALFKAEMDAVLFEYEPMNDKLVNHKMAAHWEEKQELTKKRVKAGKARAEKARSLETEKAA